MYCILLYQSEEKREYGVIAKEVAGKKYIKPPPMARDVKGELLKRERPGCDSYCLGKGREF